MTMPKWRKYTLANFFSKFKFFFRKFKNPKNQPQILKKNTPQKYQKHK